MGNSIWTCENCDFPNYGDTEVCVKCLRNRNTGFVLKNSLLNNPLTTLAVHKSAVIRMKVNQKASQNAPSVYSNYEQHLDHYVDKDFPPIKRSLFMNGNRVKRRNLIHSSGFRQVKRWLRPQNVFVSPEESHLPITLFSNPSPKDVIQGELGTCWFLSALALLAEKPFLLFNSMVSKYYNTYGIHQVRLNRRGEWVVVSIDDYLPCDKYRQLVFSYGRKRQFWIPFMEKALAKLYGSYEAVARGACAEGLQTLTGEPCEVLYLQLGNKSNSSNSSSNNSSAGAAAPTNPANPSSTSTSGNHEDTPFSIWQKIIYSRRMGYLMTTLCYNENFSESVFDRVGLLNRHIYSILDAREFDNDGTPVRLLRLRNPWGHKEWNGAWSDGWPSWPAHIKAQVSIYIRDDGCFWISFEDVLKYFYDITICKVRANWTESRQSSYFYDYSSAAEVYILTVTQPGTHEFEIELFATGRKNQGFDRNADPDIDLCLVICRVNDPAKGTGLTCVAFEHSVEYYITLSASLLPGYYMVFATSIRAISPESLKNPNPTDNPGPPNYYTYNLIFHGESSFALNRTRLPPEIVSDIFYSVAVKENKVKYEFNGFVRTYVISGSCTHAIVVENASPNFTIKTQLNTTSSKNLESTRMVSITGDYIPPRSRQLLVFLTPLNYRSGYVIGYKLDTQIYPYYSNGNYPLIPPAYSGLHAIRNF